MKLQLYRCHFQFVSIVLGLFSIWCEDVFMYNDDQRRLSNSKQPNRKGENENHSQSQQFYSLSNQKKKQKQINRGRDYEWSFSIFIDPEFNDYSVRDDDDTSARLNPWFGVFLLMNSTSSERIETIHRYTHSENFVH